ncbi:DUF4194 domain-containing protein [Leucobacter sp. W1478]|uniref:DUF4194 domain-containing protein n=1 Tax=Leucobacter sp. W1478 TaxID=3439065 RepID=UPI003F2D16ED
MTDSELSAKSAANFAANDFTTGATGDAETGEGAAHTGLWIGDTGRLVDLSRRALLRLVQGPYLSAKQHPRLWTALLVDRAEIESRLHELFLDLHIDEIDEFAFTRKARTGEFDAPSALRSVNLTYADTIMLLALRQQLLATGGSARTIVGQDEIFEQLDMYRDTDESTFRRNLNSAWVRMSNQFRVIHPVGEDRVEVSPVVKFLVDEDRVRALTEVYRGLGSVAAAHETEGVTE